MKITLLWNPKSTNHIYKMTCRGKFASMYMTQEWKNLKELYSLQARVQKTDFLTCDISVEVILYFWDKRKRDLDNHNKLWMDSLSGIVYEDDKQIKQMLLRKEYDRENPRIEINIKKYAE